MAENTMFKVPDGTDYITVDVNVLGKEYKLPAAKTDEQKLYRIPHKALSKLFKDLRSTNRELKMETGVIGGSFVGTVSPKYSLASCRISNGSVVGDTFFGETNVTLNSSTSEKEAPFAAAVNRAQDKAILDFIGLESQYFDEDGNPALYSADTEVKQNKPEPEKTVIVEAPDSAAGPAQDEVPSEETAEEAPNPADPVPVIQSNLTAKEQKEYESLCGQTLKLKKNGQDVSQSLSEMSDAYLNFLMNCGNEAYANLAGRYVELRNKKNGAA